MYRRACGRGYGSGMTPRATADPEVGNRIRLVPSNDHDLVESLPRARRQIRLSLKALRDIVDALDRGFEVGKFSHHALRFDTTQVRRKPGLDHATN